MDIPGDEKCGECVDLGGEWFEHFEDDLIHLYFYCHRTEEALPSVVIDGEAVALKSDTCLGEMYD